MLISSDTILRQYIPNVFATVSGEQSLYEKLCIELQLSEQWLTTHVLSDTILNQLTTTNSLEDTSSTVIDTTQTTTGDTDTSSAETDTTQTTAQPTNVSAANQQHETTNVQLKTLSARAIVSDAFVHAIPSLDLVLTPNGFGIVSNQNVAPASSERVERLIQSLITNRDLAIDALLQLLLQNADWRATTQAQYFLATLFPTLSSLCSQLPSTLNPQLSTKKEHSTALNTKPSTLNRGSMWDIYSSLHAPLILIEQELADKFISPELYARLRNTQINGDADATGSPQSLLGGVSDSSAEKDTTQTTTDANQQHIVTNTQSQTLISLLRSIELALLQGNPLPYRQLTAFVNNIRLHPADFPEWHNSSLAQLYAEPTFQNTKSSHGYWF